MAEIRSQGVVLRSRDYREADKLVTLLTRDAGKLTLVARGTKKPKSRFAALVEPLTLGIFLLHRGKNLHTLIQGEIIRPYGLQRLDLLRCAYGQYFCELCEKVLPDGEPAPAVFALLAAALELLESETEPARLSRCFELNLLDELGYRPDLDNCKTCGSSKGPFRFDVTLASLVCGACRTDPAGFYVSGAAVSTMKRFLDQGFHRLAVCLVSEAVHREILQVVTVMLSAMLGLARMKSLDFIHDLENDMKNKS